MFFLDTKGLDSIIFDQVDASRGVEFHLPQPTRRIIAFANWATGVALPLLQTAHPDLRLDDTEFAINCREATDERDIHKDACKHESIARDVIFLTLGITGQGSTSGTVLAKDPKLEGSFVHKIPQSSYASKVSEAPAGYATVFRPHKDLHASPPDINNRTILYRAIYNFDGTNGLITPDSDLCLDV